MFARPETFTGPRAANPHLFGGDLTPYLPGLAGGAAAYGMLDADAQALFNSTLFDNAPGDAVMAVVRVDGGVPGLLENFAGYDLVLVVNLTDRALDAPKLGAGQLGFETALTQAGLANEAAFGDGIDDVIPTLAAHGVYATLIPEATQGFTASAGVDGVNFQGKALTLADGEAMYVRPPGLVAEIDQTQSPEGTLSIGGKTFEALGTINVTEDPTAVDGLKVEVFLNQSSTGLAAADGVLLKRVDPVLPNLHVLDVAGNPLDNRAHDYFIPEIEAHVDAGLVASASLPADGRLENDLQLRVQVVQADGLSSWHEIVISGDVTAANATPEALVTQLQSALATALAGEQAGDRCVGVLAGRGQAGAARRRSVDRRARGRWRHRDRLRGRPERRDRGRVRRKRRAVAGTHRQCRRHQRRRAVQQQR